MKKIISRHLSKHRLSRGLKQISASYLARSFRSKNSRRLLIFHDPNRISFSQVYPFIFYEDKLFEQYSIEVRCQPFSDLIEGKVGQLPQADIILLQPWFTTPPDDLKRAFDTINNHNPHAELSFMDSYAHNDLRLAKYFPDDLKFYLKKSLFKDLDNYLKPRRGDTNLNEYYSDLYEVPATLIDFKTPKEILPKLRLSPNFFTAPHFLEQFGNSVPPQKGRPLDVHARLGSRGSPWYQAMRENSIKTIRSIPNVIISGETGIAFPKYMEELRNARLCFSPFGYGELCWRDIEAIQTGATLIKQNMDHLQTLPNLYEADVTYLPIKWDFSDLEEVVQKALTDIALREHLANEAYQRIAHYINEDKFISDVSFLFE